MLTKYRLAVPAAQYPMTRYQVGVGGVADVRFFFRGLTDGELLASRMVIDGELPGNGYGDRFKVEGLLLVRQSDGTIDAWIEGPRVRRGDLPFRLALRAMLMAAKAADDEGVGA